MHQRRPAPAPVAVSPFVGESSAPSFGARFQLAPHTSLQRAKGTAASSAAAAAAAAAAPHPSTPFTRALPSMYAGASPFATSPSAPASPASPASPHKFSGMQSPAGGSGSWAGAAWGSSSSMPSPTPSSSGHFGGSFGFGTSTPKHTSQSQYPSHLHTPTAASSASTSATPAAAASSSSSSSRISAHGASISHAAPQPSSSPPVLHTASIAKFSNPDVEQIAAQLAYVSTHKTLTSLLLSTTSLVLGVTLFIYVLVVPLMPRVSVPLLGYVLGVTVSRDVVHSLGLLAALLLVAVGGTGLTRYLSMRMPMKEMEGLSERQRKLMGWTGGPNNHGARGGARSESRLAHVAAEERQDRYQDHNALRARARVQQLTGTTPSASPPTPFGGSRSPVRSTHTPSRARSPIPSTSLRFLASGGGGSSLPVSGSRGAASPYRTPGLANAASAAGVQHARSVHDEATLSSFAREYEGMQQQQQQHRHTPHRASHGSESSFAVSSPFGTPPPTHGRGASMGSHSGGFGSLFGFGAAPAHSSVLTTPPYATSQRELPSASLHASSALPLASALGGGGAGGLGAGGLGGSSGAAGGGPFSFALPGHRFALDDPRSDADLHETFNQQLRAGSISSGHGPQRLSAALIDQYARNMRSWMVSQILRPLLHSLDASNAAMGALAAQVMAQPGVQQAFTPDEVQGLRALAHTFGSSAHAGAAAPQLTARLVDSIALLSTRFPSRPEVAARTQVDKYLAVESAAGSEAHEGAFNTSAFGVAAPVSSSTRAYVAQRLHALCMPGDDSLRQFQLASGTGHGGASLSLRSSPFTGLFGTRSGGIGGAHAFAASTPVMLPNGLPAPSDAHIILHAFCTHMEGIRPGFQHTHVKGWLSNTLTHSRMPAGSSINVAGESVCITQVRAPSLPSYFVLTHGHSAAGGRREAVKLVTEPGRASLFQAMVLFALELPKGSAMLRELAPVIERPQA